MLQHFVHAQMQYHASALENLTAICQKIQQFDEEAESKVNQIFNYNFDIY